jgi:aminoglycoside phosphotransferase (APT) family kinase protein
MILDPRLASRELGPALTDELGRVLGNTLLELAPPRRLTGGASRETWAVDATTREGRHALILRRDPPGSHRTGLDLEAAARRAAYRAGVPTPRVLASGNADGPLGYPFILSEHVSGETLARRILRDDEFKDVRPRLAAACGEILARIHAMDPSEIAGLPRVDPVEHLRARLDLYEPRPAFELAYAWLAAHRREAETTVVHGDFRLGNLIVGPDGIRGVLDWELVHLGDPMEDLGWLCVRAWRFGGPGQVGGFGSLAQLVEAYEKASQRSVDQEAIRWWELWGTISWGLGCLEMSSWHLEGLQPSVELAAIGRRVFEQEYDAMLLLEELAR